MVDVKASIQVKNSSGGHRARIQQPVPIIFNVLFPYSLPSFQWLALAIPLSLVQISLLIYPVAASTALTVAFIICCNTLLLSQVQLFVPT